MRTIKGPITDGARKLRDWLRARDLSVPTFCEKHSLDRIAVQRAMNGERRRVSVDLATLIEQATQGAVPGSSWASWTGRNDATGTEG